MLTIRFQRVGKRHQPSYRLVVVERRSKLNGPPIEYMGNYNPTTKEGEINKERLSHWLGVGAHPTLTVHNFLVRRGIIKGSKIPVPMKRGFDKLTPKGDGSASQVVSQDAGSVTPASVSVDETFVQVPPTNQEDESSLAEPAHSESAGEVS